jgi:hypothetical protein
MDQQALIQLPKTQASMLYYKSQLNVHNYTSFDLGSKTGYCYLWNETEGDMTSNEYSSIITDFLRKEIAKDKKTLVVWSDGGGYQNRNSFLSNALL